MRNNAKCADFGSEYCPCHLAQSNQCPVCTQCGGGSFCDCSGTTGYCVKHELELRGGKPKPLRPVHTCRVKKVIPFGESILIRVELPSPVVQALCRPGAFIFMRRNENPFFDTPLSVLFSEIPTNTIGVVVAPKGVKTAEFGTIRENDSVYVRGPFFSGILGLNDVYRVQNARAAVFMRGIGFLPALGVIDALRRQGNKLGLYLDAGNFNQKLLHFFEEFFELNTVACKLAGEHGISREAQERIQSELSAGARHIHFGASDFLTHSCVAFMRSTGRQDVHLSCCNNSRMCCGEAICGACTSDTAKRSRHLCKEQLSPYEYFEE